MLTKENSSIIKGIAIILMVTHHLFAFPNWWDANLLLNNGWPCYVIGHGEIASMFGSAGRICIALFAFVSGYGLFEKYQGKAEHTYRKSILGLLKLLLPYWITVCIIYAFNLCCGNSISAESLFKNLCLIDFTIDHFAWYVRFYVLVVITFPLLYYALSWLHSKKIPGIAVMLCISIASIGINKVIGYENSNWFAAVAYDYVLYIPCILIGCCTACWNWFDSLQHLADQLTKKLIWGFLLIALCVLPVRAYVTKGNLRADPYLSFLFVFCVCYFVKHVHIAIAGKVMWQIGTYSMGIWLIHSIFFFPSTNFQFIAYLPRVSVLCLVWTLFICFVYAAVLERSLKPLHAKLKQFS